MKPIKSRMNPRGLTMAQMARSEGHRGKAPASTRKAGIAAVPEKILIIAGGQGEIAAGKELAAQIGIVATSLNSAISALLVRGYVSQRRIDYRRHIAITPAGKAFLREILA